MRHPKPTNTLTLSPSHQLPTKNLHLSVVIAFCDHPQLMELENWKEVNDGDNGNNSNNGDNWDGRDDGGNGDGNVMPEEAELLKIAATALEQMPPLW